jgi:hypothetical protein
VLTRYIVPGASAGVTPDDHREFQPLREREADVGRGQPCGCRKRHPCRSCGMPVLVYGAAETVVSPYVEADDLGGGW